MDAQTHREINMTIRIRTSHDQAPSIKISVSLTT